MRFRTSTFNAKLYLRTILHPHKRMMTHPWILLFPKTFQEMFFVPSEVHHQREWRCIRLIMHPPAGLGGRFAGFLLKTDFEMRSIMVKSAMPGKLECLAATAVITGNQWCSNSTVTAVEHSSINASQAMRAEGENITGASRLCFTLPHQSTTSFESFITACINMSQQYPQHE